MGTLCGGWMMAKSAAAAAHQLGNADCENPVFMKAKLGMADIFMTHHLPQVLARAKTILEGMFQWYRYHLTGYRPFLQPRRSASLKISCAHSSHKVDSAA